MISRDPVSIKRISLWCLIIASGLMTAYLAFVSIVSVWVGVDNMHQTGFWVPVLIGISFLLIVMNIFLRITRHLLKHIKEEDVINI
jgi:hypothetical protein